jgi:hypothetical protein
MGEDLSPLEREIVLQNISLEGNEREGPLLDQLSTTVPHTTQEVK